MSLSGPIPGWQGDPASAGDDPAKRSISARLSEAWHLYRAHAGPLLVIALLFQGLLGLPLAVVSFISVRQLIGIWSGSVNWFDPGAMAEVFTFGPFGDIALDYAFLGLLTGLAGLAYALAIATTTYQMLGEPSERWQAGPALRATFTRGLGIVLAGIAVTLAVGAVYWLQGVSLARQVDYDLFEPYTGGDVGFALGIALLVLVLEIVALYCLVRWVAAIGAIVIEQRSLRASLARSNELTRGRRRWIAGHLLAAGLLLAILVLILEYGTAAVVAGGFGTSSPAFAVALAVAVVGVPILLGPLPLVYLAALFRDLRDAGSKQRSASVDAPAGWPSGG